MSNNLIVTNSEKFSKIATAIKTSNTAIDKSNEAILDILDMITEWQNENNAKFDKLSESIISIQEKKNHQENPQDGYVTQGGIGAAYSPSIGSIYVGTLLRKVGLAQQFEGKTVPLRKHIESNLVKSTPHDYYTVYTWNLEKTLKYIDNWLIKNNLMNEFTAIKTESEMKDFINNL